MPTLRPIFAPVERPLLLPVLLFEFAGAEDGVVLEVEPEAEELEEEDDDEEPFAPTVAVAIVMVAFAAMSEMISVSVACHRTCINSAHAVGVTEAVTRAIVTDVREGSSGSGPDANVDVENTFVRTP